MKKKVIALIGRAGSGKSTLGRRFAEEHNCKYISTGDLARSMKDLDWQARGDLAPEDLIRQMVLDEVAIAREDVIILDGMPRIPSQVYFLADHFDVQFVKIVCEPHIAKQRLKDRGRVDDTDEAIEARMAVYDANIAHIMHVIHGLSDNGIIVPVGYIMQELNPDVAYYWFEGLLLGTFKIKGGK